MLGEAVVAETDAGQGALLFLCLRWTAQLLMRKTLLQRLSFPPTGRGGERGMERLRRRSTWRLLIVGLLGWGYRGLLSLLGQFGV